MEAEKQNLQETGSVCSRSGSQTPVPRDLRGDGEREENKCARECWALLLMCKRSSYTKLLAALVLGQALSALLCGTGVSSQLLFSKHSIEVPTTQAFLNYLLLGFVYGVPMAMKKDFWSILRKNWWKYVFLGLVDVEANYLIILAYKYTNLTTIQLLDSFAIVTVIALSCVFLRTRYKIINFMGVALALIGILSLVMADLQGSRANRGSNPLLGDLLCLVGVVLYAVSNVAQEFLVNTHSVMEYLGFIGITGSIISGVQVIVLDRKALATVDWTLYIGFLFATFGVCQFLFYTITPLLLRLTSAVVFNISLLTADFYTLLFGIYYFRYSFSFFYVLAFILVILGVFIYNLRQPKRGIKDMEDDDEQELRRHKTKKKDKDSTGSKTISEGSIFRGLRGLLESQTYEMSEGGEVAERHQRRSNNPQATVSRIASKLTDKLPELSKPKTSQSSESHDNILEQKELVGGPRNGHVVGRTGSSGSDSTKSQYGSIEKHSSPPRTTDDSEIKHDPLPESAP